jgi:hypothetical protein
MDLLTNAVQAIQVGIEDYEMDEQPRLLSAVRNIHAGVLLLYKEGLRRLSPANSADALIKAKIAPSLDASGSVIFVGDGKKTVDTQQIKERFNALGIKTDWTRMDRITNVRNDLEHFYPQAGKKALQGLIADSFLIVRDFIADQLGDNPRDLLGEKAWETMLQIAEVYNAEHETCGRLLGAIDWGSTTLADGVYVLSCNNCGSQLLRPDGTGAFTQGLSLTCNSCGDSERAESFVPRAVDAALAGEADIAFKDGGEAPYGRCPECALEAYVVAEDLCVFCGESPDRTCIRCGSEIPVCELDSWPMCSWCAHMSTKDD